MRILVTGALGFLGGRVAKHFVRAGHDVRLGTRRLAQAVDYQLAPATVAPLSWSDPSRLEEACAGVDVVVHPSGMNARDCAADPAAAMQVNAAGTAALLRAANQTGVRRFIYTSTSHVYTGDLHGVITEETPAVNPHPYAASARAAEDAVREAHGQGRLDGVVIRLSNGYGVPLHRDVNCWMLLVNDLCQQAVETGRLRLASDGSQLRNFIPMREICRVVDFLVCGLRLDRPIGAAGPINVGGGRAQTILEMGQRVRSRCEEILGETPALVTSGPAAASAPRDLDFRVDKLHALGYRSIDDGAGEVDEIDNLLRYCRREFGRS